MFLPFLTCCVFSIHINIYMSGNILKLHMEINILPGDSDAHIKFSMDPLVYSVLNVSFPDVDTPRWPTILYIYSMVGMCHLFNADDFAISA